MRLGVRQRGSTLQADAFPWARGEPTSSLRSLWLSHLIELIHRESPPSAYDPLCVLLEFLLGS